MQQRAVLVARHENEIGGTTDVADHPEFAGLHFTALPLISNAPPYSPHRDNPQPGPGSIDPQQQPRRTAPIVPPPATLRDCWR